MIKKSIVLLVFSFALGVMSRADELGPSENTNIALGNGYVSRNPASGKQSPFKSLETRWESNGTQESSYKIEYTQELSSSLRELYAGGEVKAKVFFWSGGASFSFSSLATEFKSSYSLNFFAKTDYGNEILNDVSVANLKPEALLLVNNPAGWQARYGDQIVTKRRRGALIVGKITFNTLDSRYLKNWAGRFSVAYNGNWAGSFSANTAGLLDEALSSLGASINLSAWGGNGLSELQLLPIDGPANKFQSYLNMISRYTASFTRENSATIGYGTDSYRTFVPWGKEVYNPSVGPVFLKYASIRGRADAIRDMVNNAPSKLPWMNSDQLDSLKSNLEAMDARAIELFQYGDSLTKTPKLVAGKPIPADIFVPFPTIPDPQITTTVLYNIYGDGIDYLNIHLRFPGAFRLKGTWFYAPHGKWVDLGYNPESTGTMLGISAQNQLYPAGENIPYRVYDQNGVLLQQSSFPVVRTN